MDDITAGSALNFDSCVTVNPDGSLEVGTFNSSSTGKTGPNATTTIDSIPEKCVCYTAAYVDTIYNILCAKFDETKNNSPLATAKLWEIVVGMPADCKTALERDFSIDVPEGILIFDLGENLMTYSQQLADECGEDENIVILMTEYNIRSTNAKITESTVQTIESNTGGKVKFVFVLSNSLSMVMSNTEMIGTLLGIDNTQDFIENIQIKIHVMKDAISKMQLESKKKVYVETAAGKAAGSENLITNLLTDILDLKNIADYLELMDSKLSDEQIVSEKPDIIIF